MVEFPAKTLWLFQGENLNIWVKFGFDLSLEFWHFLWAPCGDVDALSLALNYSYFAGHSVHYIANNQSCLLRPNVHDSDMGNKAGVEATP